MARPLFEIAREITAAWPVPSPHAKAYLKAMHYVIDIDDSFAAGSARRIVRCFLLYSKEWQGRDAERIKEELRAISLQAEATAPAVAALAAAPHTPAEVGADGPSFCGLCKLAITDKFVHGHSVWG